MKRSSLSTVCPTAAWTLVLGLLPERAEAYLDPGSGSLLLQMLLAGLLGLLMTLKIYWRRIKSFIRERLGRRGDDPE